MATMSSPVPYCNQPFVPPKERAPQTSAELSMVLLLLFVSVATALSASETILRGVLISAVSMTILLPLFALFAKRRLDLFEPIIPAAAALFMMFVVRPIVDQMTSNYNHLGYNILPTFDETLVTALIGCAAFNLGYLSNFGKFLHGVFPKPGLEFQRKKVVQAAIVLTAFGLALYGVYLHSNGGLPMLLLILKGRSKELGDISRHSTGYLYSAINLLVPASLALFAAWLQFRRRTYLLVLSIFMAAPFLAVGSAQGSRSGLLPLLLGLAAVYYLYMGRRPKIRNVILAAVLVLVAFSILREFRNARSLARKNVSAVLSKGDIGGSVAATFSSDDAEMFDTLANTLSVVPSRLSYQPFGLFTDLAIRAIPRVLYPNKPLEASDELIAFLWPMHFQYSRASAANSIFGNFYVYGGIIGVAIGAFLLGMLFNQTWKWFRRNANNLNAVLLYAFVPGFVVILFRGTITDTLGRMFFTVLPLVIAQRFWRRKA